MKANYRLAIDTGGTFTDFTLWNENSGGILYHKWPAIPKDPAKSVIDGLSDLLESFKISANELNSIIVGTTIGVNTVIQRSGPKTAMLVTEGIRDILDLGLGFGHLLNRFDFLTDKPHQLVERKNVIEIPERILSTGEVSRPLANEVIPDIIDNLRKRDIEVIAICLFNSYANAIHERRLKEALTKALPNIPLSVSTDVWPEFKEYQRATLTILDAYTKPALTNYLQSIKNGFNNLAINCPIFLLKLNGGITDSESARLTPIETITSGTTAGAVGVAHVANLLGISQCLGLDIGGTSADVSYVIDEKLGYRFDRDLAGLPMIIPSIDVDSVGAGGGSIAWVDSGGVLKVGPQSAGADPGPACYGLGGSAPTVTDAYVVCGYIDPAYFLGGRMRLNRDLAVKSIKELGDKLSLDAEQTAEGILKVVTSTMAMRVLFISSSRGFNIRECSLLAFGGAGPTHTPFLLDELQSSQVIIPPSPGTFSALGNLATDFTKDSIRSVRSVIQSGDIERVRMLYREMLDELNQWLHEQSKNINHVRVVCTADMRYKPQSFTLEVALSDEDLSDANSIAQRFHDRHRKEYGFFEDADVLVDNLRVKVIGIVPKIKFKMFNRASNKSPQPFKTGELIMNGRKIKAKVYRREKLLFGNVVEGPAIIEQMDTTTVLPPSCSAKVNRHGFLIIKRQT